MTAWTYAADDVQARVETIRRGDRIYLPGPRGGARVVAEVRHYPACVAGEHVSPESYVVLYFTGERARPLRFGDAPAERGELLVQGTLGHPPGTRLRCRRCVRAQ